MLGRPSLQWLLGKKRNSKQEYQSVISSGSVHSLFHLQKMQYDVRIALLVTFLMMYFVELFSNFNVLIMVIKSVVLLSYMSNALIERFTKLTLS